MKKNGKLQGLLRTIGEYALSVGVFIALWWIYVAVNLNNYHTIEFRLFRGTLKYNTFIATLQMVNHICDAAISLSEEGIDAMSWSEFVSSIREPELIQYLKERRLYVNEMVTESEEM